MKKLIYQFTESDKDNAYLLLLNGGICWRYSKERYSKQEAEDKASDLVNRSIKKYGNKVQYDGNIVRMGNI